LLINFKRSFSTPGDKDKLEQILVSEMMSSEESGGEDCDVIAVRPLPWCSTRVDGWD